MRKPNHPKLPSKITTIDLNEMELDLVETLRRYSFGEFVIYKADGLLLRIEIKESRLLGKENRPKR